MFQLSAPYPAVEAISVLPNPELGDSRETMDSLSIRRSMNGTRRTYIKRKNRERLLWSFVLTRGKAIELREFYLAYGTEQVRVETLGKQWVGWLISNPVEFEAVRRGEPGSLGETVAVQIEFEGEPLVSI